MGVIACLLSICGLVAFRAYRDEVALAPRRIVAEPTATAEESGREAAAAPPVETPYRAPPDPAPAFVSSATIASIWLK